MSNESKTVVVRKGMGLCSIFFLILFLLKVGVVETAVIGYSWWWITAPLWGPTALTLAILALIVLVGIVIVLIVGIVRLISLLNKKIRRRMRNAKK